MIKAILRFARLCRAAGLRVSTSEVLDGIRHIAWIDLSDEEQFHAAMKANFVKSRLDEGRFEEIYGLYFSILSMGADFRRSRSLSRRLIEIVAGLDTESKESGRVFFPDLPSHIRSALLRELQAMFDIDPDTPEVSFADILSSQGEPPGNLDGPPRDIRQNKGMGISGEGPRNLGDLLTERLAMRLEADAAGSALHPVSAPARGRILHNGLNLGDLLFNQLSEEETREVHLAIARLARKLRDRVATRYRRKREGIVDVKNTLRIAFRYEAVPLEIRFRRKRPKKPRIVALCDVSYSVWQAVPFMLNILYSIQDCLSRVRSFVFIARVVDVSNTMKDHDVLGAVDRVMADYKMQFPRNAVYGNETDREPADHDPEISDYGEALSHFSKDYMDVLDQKTTLIILGDGRTNFLDPRPHLLEALQGRCRRIIWLNPEPRHLWGDGDSAVEAYRPFCSEIRPCRNLNDLTEFISGLIL